jgi:hypothetical protein
MSPKAATVDPPANVAPAFHYEARSDGRVVATLRGVPTGDGGLTVEADVFPVGSKPDEGLSRPFPFTSESSARRFVDEALVALEYLGCDVRTPGLE